MAKENEILGPPMRVSYLPHPSENPALFGIAWKCITFNIGRKGGISLYFPGQWYLNLSGTRNSMREILGTTSPEWSIVNGTDDADFTNCLGRCVRIIEPIVETNLIWVADQQERTNLRNFAATNQSQPIREVHDRHHLQFNNVYATIFIKAISDLRVVEMAGYV